jgi:hypothetical protein
VQRVKIAQGYAVAPDGRDNPFTRPCIEDDDRARGNAALKSSGGLGAGIEGRFRHFDGPHPAAEAARKRIAAVTAAFHASEQQLKSAGFHATEHDAGDLAPLLLLGEAVA